MHVFVGAGGGGRCVLCTLVSREISSGCLGGLQVAEVKVSSLSADLYWKGSYNKV